MFKYLREVLATQTCRKFATWQDCYITTLKSICRINAIHDNIDFKGTKLLISHEY